MGTNNLGEALKRQRISKELTLKELSLESGVSLSHLARIERGERFPSGRILRKLAEPLGLEETEILKMAGFLSRDASDDRLARLKEEIKREIAEILVSLHKKIDSL
ncbi:hypothetical protein ES706_05266 [subsurface metagenome]